MLERFVLVIKILAVYFGEEGLTWRRARLIDDYFISA